MERKSEHPLARAILEAAEQRGLELAEIDDFQSVPGKGVRGRLNGSSIFAGSERFAREWGGSLPAELDREIERLEGEGRTCIVTGSDGGFSCPCIQITRIRSVAVDGHSTRSRLTGRIAGQTPHRSIIGGTNDG